MRSVLAVILCCVAPRALGAFANGEAMLADLFRFWGTFRDSGTGAFCDTVYFGSGPGCGPSNNRYSSAGTGMGLIADCAFAEAGLLSRQEAESRALQTLNTILKSWPRDPWHGFFIHWTDRTWKLMSGGYSTIDTAEMTMGALFAGNYYGGKVQELAHTLANLTAWPDAIQGADDPVIYPIANSTTGTMQGTIKPYNEYYIVAYLAKLSDPAPEGKAARFFDTYFGTNAMPAGHGGYPVHKNYWGFDILTDNPGHFVSSFIPQFCWFQTRGFQENPYYASHMMPNWMRADMKYWELALPPDARLSGHNVSGRVWGSGAGPGPGGYDVERLGQSTDLVFSAAIMAGFLPVAGEMREAINNQLHWLYDNDVCTYTQQLPGGNSSKVLWRCSVKQPQWRATSADSIDYATLVLGYLSNYVPTGFYGKFAA
eukprot:TRINITY_DN5934_c0_g1_i1.p1 TRINITY_DN5934_c0_g1~~TRINITY_DN5934_c0_g1_i1.p1  ORF type:complete len:427 (+),score=68.86 TRINITY_DN5934_c0_g1_i1:92-1372(+)